MVELKLANQYVNFEHYFVIISFLNLMQAKFMIIHSFIYSG